MSWKSITLTALGLSIFAIFAQQKENPGANQPPTNAAPDGAGSASSNNAAARKISVNIFFTTNNVAAIEDLRDKAMALLASRGYRVDDSYACTINVVFYDKRFGSFVHFVGKRGEPAYEVEFDRNGVITKTRTAIRTF